MKIFKIGSCRTGIKSYLNPKYQLLENFDFTHTTKEVLMYLEIFDGKDLSEITNINCLFKNHMDFNISKYRDFLEKSDILIIEISSLKLVEDRGNFYQLVRTKENKKIDEFKIYTQDADTFLEDVKQICQRIKKPIIFVPHINLNFGENQYELNETRDLIEKYITSFTKYHVKTSKIFEGYNYTEICDCSKKFDPNHYTKLGYQILTKEIEKIIDVIKNDNF
jgi:hypothetical protein